MTGFSLSHPFPSYHYIGALWDGRLQGSIGLRMRGLEVGLHTTIKDRVRVRLHSIIFSYYICQIT